MESTRIKVSLNSIDKIKRFADLANKFSFDIDLASGRYVVDAKSVLGIFSLNLIEELECIIYADSKDAQEFIDTIDKMIVKHT